MTLVRFNQQPAVSPFSNLFDNLFGKDGADFFQNFGNVPAVNVFETENSFELALAAPGYSKEDFRIKINQNVLTLSASKKQEESTTEGKFTRKEFHLQSFERSFTLPKSVNTEEIHAGYENGILNVRIPKRVEEKEKAVREISIA